MDFQPIIMLFADGLVVPIVLLAGFALLVYVPKGLRYDLYVRVLMAGLTSYMLAKIVGYFYQPASQRPFEMLGLEPGASYLDNPGFPSDHMLFCAFLALAVWFVTRKKWLSITIGVLALAVGLGRVLALVHSPVDIIGGIVFALLGAVWYIVPGQTTTSISKPAKK